MKRDDSPSTFDDGLNQLRPQDLIGAWRLVSCQVRFADGRPPVYPFGERASGLLIYSADGEMSATLCSSDRDIHGDLRLESARQATQEERAAAYDSYMAYDGRWFISSPVSDEHGKPERAPAWGRRGVVTHEVERALTPNAMNASNVRNAALINDQLSLSYSLMARSGVRRDYELVWRRAEAHLSAEARPPSLNISRGRLWLSRHQSILASAVRALRTRGAWSPFIESPSRKLHPEGARESGLEAYQARLGRPFSFSRPLAGEASSVDVINAERSPYSGEALRVSYPRVSVEALYADVESAWETWRWATRGERAGVCLEIIDRWARASFEIAYATMHTAGQGFMLAFAGSGASSLDRGLEALAAAWIAMGEIPDGAHYERSFGGADPARLLKRYHCAPVGVAVVFSCGSYPAWNAYPAIMANLMTGNPVIIKPHPQTILPVAIAVDLARSVLSEAGFDPNLITLAADSWDEPIGLDLVDHPSCAIVDFTGGQHFGSLLERRDPRLQVYTETSGCNAVLLHSTDRLDEMLDAIAQGLCLFSAQMCTAPQNLWMSETGFKVYRQSPEGGVLELYETLSPAQFGALLTARIDALLEDPKRAAGICGALHAEATLRELDAVRGELTELGAPLVRESSAYDHPEHAEARTATPLIGALNASERAPAQAERFGPISFVISAPDEEALIRGATGDARRVGAIATYAYSVDEAWTRRAERACLAAGASLGVNLYRQRPMNFTAAFSDVHVTGLNPAGTASLTDPGFVSRRFRIVQVKREV